MIDYTIVRHRTHSATRASRVDMKKLEKQEAKLRVCFMTERGVSYLLNVSVRPRLRSVRSETSTRALSCLINTKSRYDYTGFTDFFYAHVFFSNLMKRCS